MTCILQVSHRRAVSCSRLCFHNSARGCSGPRHTVSLPHHTVSYYFPHSFHTFIHSLMYLLISVMRERAAQLCPVGQSPGVLADVANKGTPLLILSAPPPAPYQLLQPTLGDTGWPRLRAGYAQPVRLTEPFGPSHRLLPLSPPGSSFSPSWRTLIIAPPRKRTNN